MYNPSSLFVPRLLVLHRFGTSKQFCVRFTIHRLNPRQDEHLKRSRKTTTVLSGREQTWVNRPNLKARVSQQRLPEGVAFVDANLWKAFRKRFCFYRTRFFSTFSVGLKWTDGSRSDYLLGIPCRCVWFNVDSSRRDFVISATMAAKLHFVFTQWLFLLRILGGKTKHPWRTFLFFLFSHSISLPRSCIHLLIMTS